MNHEAQETQGNPTQGFGWVFYDGHCPICSRWVGRFTDVLLRRRYLTAPLQRGWVQERLALGADAVLAEMHVIRADGKHFGGADALVFLARQIWWTMPLALLAKLPGGMGLLSRAYRLIAQHRYCGAAACSTARAANTSRRKKVHLEPGREADRAA